MSDFTEQRRLSFGLIAEQYDQARPSYPEQLVEDVISYAGGPLATGSGNGRLRTLEVGAGTGIATVQFAARGLEVTALEPDAAMAAVASRRAATAGLNVRLVISDFESADATDFDLIISGTAWHWTNPERRYELAARALKPGGALCAFWNRPVWEGSPVRPGFDAAYASVSDAFIERGPFYTDRHDPLVDSDEWMRELAPVAEFVDPEVRVYPWTTSYTSAQYVALLGTHSDHRLLDAEPKRRLFDQISTVIDDHGGSFELTYEGLLCLARRRPL